MRVRRGGERWDIRRLWLDPGPRFESGRVRRIEDTPAPYGISRYQWFGGAGRGPILQDVVVLAVRWTVRRLVWLARELMALPARMLGLRPWTVVATRLADSRELTWRVYGKDHRDLIREFEEAVRNGRPAQSVSKELRA